MRCLLLLLLLLTPSFAAASTLHLEGRVVVEALDPSVPIVVEARHVRSGQALASTRASSGAFALDVPAAAVEGIAATEVPDYVDVAAAYDLDGDGVLGAQDRRIGVEADWLMLYLRPGASGYAVPAGAQPGWNAARRPAVGERASASPRAEVSDLAIRPNLLPSTAPIPLDVQLGEDADDLCLGVEAPRFVGSKSAGVSLVAAARVEGGRARLVLPMEPAFPGLPTGPCDTTYGRFVRWPAADRGCTAFDPDAEGVETWYQPFVTFVRTSDPEAAWSALAHSGAEPNAWYFVDRRAVELAGDLTLGPR